MTFSTAAGKLGIIAMAILGAYNANAADTDQYSDWYTVGKVENPWYVGVNGGQSVARIDNDAVSNQLLGAGYAKSRAAEDERGKAFKVFGGFQLNKLFALELGYFELGQSSFVLNTVPTGTYSGTTRIRGANIDLLASTPVYEKFSVFGRVGAQYAEAKENFVGSGLVIGRNYASNHRDTNIKYGVGMQYAVNDNLSLRLEAERYSITNVVDRHGNVDTVTVGLVYRFGGSPTYTRVVTPAPAYVPPPAPEPAPVVVVAAPPPPPPAPVRVTFAADSFFEFGKAGITADGQQALNKFVSDLNGVSYDTINVIGHTDRIGSHNFNMKLSTARAESVKDALVKSGVPAEKITAKGVNGSEPMTKPEDCKGNKATKALIACLQPDRRVDIDVVGTKAK